MNDKIKIRTIDAAKFWYESSKFFQSICLLTEAISNQLTNHGYKPLFKSYGLKFAASDPGETRLVYDRLKNHWFGEFSLGDYVEEEKDSIYGFGVAFGSNDPESDVSPWLPFTYFFKSKMIDGSEWKHWEYPQALFSPAKLMYALLKNKEQIINIDVSGFDAIGFVKAIIFPIGAILNSDDLAKIIKPAVEALRYDDEKKLESIGEYMFTEN